MKVLSVLAVLLCMVFCFCACGKCNNTETTGETAETTVATVTEETVAETTVAVADEDADADDTATTITEDEAIKMVKDEYDFGDGYSYTVRSVEEIDGVSYYGVDLRKLIDDHYTYYTTYFVAADGSEIVEGYYENDQPGLFN